MDQIHETVDHNGCGPWWTTGGGSRRARWRSRSGPLCSVGARREFGKRGRSSGGGGVLTEGFSGRFDGEVRPAAVKGEQPL
jgi:hypothetical protein